ncbi:hypothetical protein WA026_018313 [Henosepilachna vigintioctopunctata]|uniref:Lipase domain-containing protein n=1 Tax=Henosepilachna vigintioctopunctata TaxID=420089 RepID=A0AAW1VE50_9CUCU
MKFLWIFWFLVLVEKEKVDAGILGEITSAFTGIASKIEGAADTAISDTITTFQEVVGIDAKLEDLKFYLFTLLNRREPLVVNPLNPVSLTDGIGFRRIFFIVHGRKESYKEPWVVELTEKLLYRYPDCKVVVVDWSGVANQEYAFAVYSTESVGKLIADVLTRLTVDLQTPVHKVLLIGYSVGAHVCGFAGKHYAEKTHHKLPKIIALDPAGVLFVLRPEHKKLNRYDAEIVQVIHTDGGKIGLTQPYGTIDFYPNGGLNQPGCPLLDIFNIENTVNCDHNRAYEYFIESIQYEGSFAARQCLTPQELKNKACSGKEVAMGDLDIKETGVFFLYTNAHKPFSTRIADESLITNVFHQEDVVFPSVRIH